MSSQVWEDFQPWVPKVPKLSGTLVEGSTSKLSVISIVFATLAWTVLPLVGAIVAIATGHAAIYRIRRSCDQLKGKSLAILGLVLGYLNIVVTALVAVLMMLALPIMFQAIGASIAAEVEKAQKEADEAHAWVKTADQMTREDFELIEGQGIKVKPEEILGSGRE
jgi:uncharacterized membrane protein